MSKINDLRILSVFLLILHSSVEAFETKLTFDLADRSIECFHQYISTNFSVTFDYQVISGGDFDIDVTLNGPNQEIIYKKLHKQYDNINFKTNISGVYTVCLGNEFSMFAHKIVFMLMDIASIAPEITQRYSNHEEDAIIEIHKHLNYIHDSLIHLLLMKKLHENQFNEYMNEQIGGWSLLEMLVIVATSVSQVLIIRGFFTKIKNIPSKQKNLRLNHYIENLRKTKVNT